MTKKRKCPDCYGSGVIDGFVKCSTCDGTGYELTPGTLPVGE